MISRRMATSCSDSHPRDGRSCWRFAQKKRRPRPSWSKPAYRHPAFMRTLLVPERRSGAVLGADSHSQPSMKKRLSKRRRVAPRPSHVSCVPTVGTSMSPDRRSSKLGFASQTTSALPARNRRRAFRSMESFGNVSDLVSQLGEAPRAGDPLRWRETRSK